MALSNIFREPRREITETGVGILLVIPGIVASYYLGNNIAAHDSTCPLPVAYVLAALCVVIGGAGLCGLAVFLHYLGEEFCDYLEFNFRDRGIRLRPKQRY